MEDLAGGIGKNVSAIAKNFNNSVQATINAEAKIEKRSGFARFFAGGDHDAAEAIEAEVEQNKLRIQELKQLKRDVARILTVIKEKELLEKISKDK